jgi:AcrR family transcriptional regulator
MPDNDNAISATRRQPKQRRSRLLVASIREACLRILQDGAPEQLTAKRIAEVAGVAIGSFYQYYPNKEAVLLDVLLERAPGEAERIADETRHIQQLRRESLEATLRELIDVTCERHLRLLALHGEIYRRYHRVIDFHELVRASVARYVEVASWEDWMRVLLEEHRADIGVASLDIAAFLVAGTIVDTGARAVDTAPEWLASPPFRADLLHMLMRYLRRDSDGPRPRT